LVPRYLIAGLLHACILACLLTGCSSQKAQLAGPPPPTPVSVAIATQESVPVELRAVGTVEPSATVQVKSQIAGQLMSVHFKEGADIKQGDLLFQIDPRPYREALRQAEAAVARDSAQIHQAEANVARDQAQAKSVDADAARNTQLAKEGIMSQAQADQSRSAADALHESIRANQAAVESSKAAIDSDKAAIDNAKLNLSYCEIRSPMTGRAGNLLVQPGNQVKVSDVPLVVINKLTPIFVSFGVPQQHLPAIRANSARRPLAVQVSLQGDSSKSARGTLAVIDNTVDTATGTIRLKATFGNENRFLWPGQFVNVVLELDTQNNATVVPSEAVQAGQRGQMVYVVKPDQSVEPRTVTVGANYGRKIVIEKGIAPGETVVTDGQLRLFPGARVKPVPASKVDSQSL
jgi:multidrug efflux system membrane fusion protein